MADVTQGLEHGGTLAPAPAKRPAGRILLALSLPAALLFPLVSPNDYYLYVMTLAFITGLAASGLNLVMGYCGQLNMAHAGFMAIGAYVVGLLTVDHGVPFWLAFAAAPVIAAALAVPVGIVSLRLKTHYFVIFTLCVGFIIYLLIEKSDWLTHGAVGVIGIPAPPGFGPVRFDQPVGIYYLVLAFLAAGLWIMGRIVRSLLGHAFIAIRNSEELAEALGVNLMRTKLLAFVLSTIYAAVAGALYAGFVRFLGPALALETHTFEMLAYVLVGGIGTLGGPLLGTLLLTGTTQSLQFLQDYRMIVYGPMLILLVMYMPHGLLGRFRSGATAGAVRTGGGKSHG